MSMSLPHRELGLLALLLTAGPPDRLTAQVTWSGQLGATLTSTMVTDQVSGSIKVAPTIAPTLILGATFPLKTKTPVDASLEFQVTTATLQRDEDGAKTDLASMRTFALTAGIGGRIIGPVRYRAAAGFISYLTTEQESIFQDGNPTRAVGQLGVEYQRPLSPTLTMTGVVRYDVHGFTTKQLETSGYTGTQIVHRVMVGVGVSR
jgi:hypothetical protein